MIGISSNRVNLDNLRSRYQDTLKSIPVRFGAAAVEHTKENFRDGGFVDESLTKWPARKNDKDPGRGVIDWKGHSPLEQGYPSTGDQRYDGQGWYYASLCQSSQRRVQGGSPSAGFRTYPEGSQRKRLLQVDTTEHPTT